jgi:hypothetical protein
MILNEGLLYDGETAKCGGLLFLGDLHLTSQRPGRRIEEDWPGPLLRKLEFCANLAAERDLYPVSVGDKFERAVEKKESVKIGAVRAMRNFPYVPLWNIGNHDTNNKVLGDDDSLTLLAECGVLDAVTKNGAVGRFSLNGVLVGLGMTPYGMEIPKSVPSELRDCQKVVWVTHADLAFDIDGCDLVVNGHMHMTKDPVVVGRTSWFNIGSLVRDTVDLIDHVPTAWIFDGRRLEPVEVPHERHVFNLVGKLIAPTGTKAMASQIRTENTREESAFVSLLKEKTSLDMKKTDDGSVVREEMVRAFDKLKTGPVARLVLDRLLKEASGG